MGDAAAAFSDLVDAARAEQDDETVLYRIAFLLGELEAVGEAIACSREAGGGGGAPLDAVWFFAGSIVVDAAARAIAPARMPALSRLNAHLAVALAARVDRLTSGAVPFDPRRYVDEVP